MADLQLIIGASALSHFVTCLHNHSPTCKQFEHRMFIDLVFYTLLKTIGLASLRFGSLPVLCCFIIFTIMKI